MRRIPFAIIWIAFICTVGVGILIVVMTSQPAASTLDNSPCVSTPVSCSPMHPFTEGVTP